MVLRANGHFYMTDAGGTAPFNPTLFLETSTGAFLTMSGQWVSNSDRNKKENFTPLDGEGLLEKIAALPITQWNYKIDPDDVKHVGPMAQDFHAAFGLGQNNKTISGLDIGGVSLAAIQELNAKLSSKHAEIAILKRQNEALEARLAGIEAALADLARRAEGETR